MLMYAWVLPRGASSICTSFGLSPFPMAGCYPNGGGKRWAGSLWPGVVRKTGPGGKGEDGIFRTPSLRLFGMARVCLSRVSIKHRTSLCSNRRRTAWEGRYGFQRWPPSSFRRHVPSHLPPTALATGAAGNTVYAHHSLIGNRPRVEANHRAQSKATRTGRPEQGDQDRRG